MANPSILRRVAHAFVAAGLCASAPSLLLAQPAATPPAPAAPAAQPSTKLYKCEPGPFSIRTIDENWVDAARTPERTIPVRIFLPTTAQASQDAPAARDPVPPARFPVIIFSHGLGGSRINYAYFARHLASHGYIVILPSHPGSDTAASLEWLKVHGDPPAKRGEPGRLRPRAESGADATDPAQDDRPGGWLMSSINDPTNLRERPRDMSFVISSLPNHPILGPIADMFRVGVGGHSFGAYTAMAIAGMKVDLPASHGGPGQKFRDPRVKAVLPMSPEGAGTMGIVPTAWDAFDTPVLFLTGTRDYGAGGRSATWRRQAFESIRGVDDYLITLAGAGHMTFGRPDGPLAEVSKGETNHSAMIRSLGTAFFDAYIRDDASAKAWLTGFATGKPAGCLAEFKPAKSSK